MKILIMCADYKDSMYSMESFFNNNRAVIREINKRMLRVLTTSGAEFNFLHDPTQLRGRNFDAVIIGEYVSGDMAQLATTRVR